MGKLRTFLALARADQIAFLQALAWVCASKLGLSTLGLSRTLRLLQKRIQVTGTGRPAALPRSARWIPVAAGYCPGGASCLVRSLALLGILQRRGIASELCIGVGNTKTTLEAHAWIEIDGVPVNDSADVTARYSPFDRPLSRARAAP